MLRGRIILVIGFIISVMSCLQAYAALNLELTRGIAKAMPIAIIPFAGGQQNVAGHQTVTGVIKNDLQNSGQFRVMMPGLLAAKPSTPAQINFDNYRKKGVDDVLIGKIKNLGGNRYQVSFQLMGVFDRAEQKNATGSGRSALLTQSFTVTQAGLRGLAHHISDLIFQKLTGARGIFSTKIAYILVQRPLRKPAQYTLEVADYDGFNPQTLLASSQPIMSPAWSPDGRKIAYVSFEGHRASIYIQDLATGRRKLISQFPGINGAPAFSPDGKKLALVLTRTGNPKIYILDIASHQLTQLTQGYSIDTEPAFAPDGQSLIFTSNRGGTPQIYQYHFANHQINRVTYDGNYNARASFLPSGQDIVMMHRETGMFSIAKENLTTGRVQVLIQTGDDESPSIAPNGKMVLYATRHGGRGILAAVSINGKVKLLLPSREGTVQEPAWSPYLS